MTNDLISEIAGLLATARGLLADNTTHKETTPAMETDNTTMNHPTLSPEQANDLYLSGRTVWEIAQGYGLTYAKTRKILAAAGTPIRPASLRLKGRTRKSKTTADA